MVYDIAVYDAILHGIGVWQSWALAMQPLGRIAGSGASLTAAASSLIAVGFATLFCWFHDATVLPLALGYVVAGVATLLFLRRGHSAGWDLVCYIDLSGASAPN